MDYYDDEWRLQRVHKLFLDKILEPMLKPLLDDKDMWKQKVAKKLESEFCEYMDILENRRSVGDSPRDKEI